MSPGAQSPRSQRPGQLTPGRMPMATPVEQRVHELYDLVELAQVRQATREVHPPPAFGSGQPTLDHQRTMLAQVSDLLGEPFALACGLVRLRILR